MHALLLYWQEESNNARTPTSEPLDFLYELLREERCAPFPPNHLYLGTIHSAKGLEFKHVLLMDGGWRRSNGGRDNNEERRLYYVAMTRAKENLYVYQRTDLDNPFIADLSSDHTLISAPQPSPGLRELALKKQYTRLGPADIFLSYAGTKPAGHPIHAALAILQTGDKLEMKRRNNELLLYSGPLAVAALSQKSAAYWLERLTMIETISISAILRRFADDSEPRYRKRYQVERWEVPMVEIACRWE